MRAIIICAGGGSRWGNHTGVPKHFVQIDGEPILHRTVRLLLERGITDIHVVSKDDKRYFIEGTKRFIASLDYKNNADADKFLSSQNLWSQEGRTVVFYGDVFFTEEAMDTIVQFDERRWTLFCRPHASLLTKTPWGECFAQSFYPEDIDRHREALHKIAKLFKTGVLYRCGGWEHFNAFVGVDGKAVNDPVDPSDEHCFIIDDWTDDFDYPEDYDRFVELYGKKC